MSNPGEIQRAAAQVPQGCSGKGATMTKSGKVAMRKAISHSSFNTKTARQLRAKTPPAVTRTIVRKTSASKKSAR